MPQLSAKNRSARQPLADDAVRQHTSYARKRAHASRRPIFTAVPPSRAAPPSPPRTLRRLDGGGGGPAPGLLSNAGYACGTPRPEGPVEFPPAPSCSTGSRPSALRSPITGYRGWGCGAADAPAAVVAAPAMAETEKCDPRGVPAQSGSHIDCTDVYITLGKVLDICSVMENVS